jgi:hypothetical protein
MKKLLGVFLVVLLAVALTACGGSGKSHTADEVIEAFKKAGLEVEDIKDVKPENLGMAPNTHKEGKLFQIPSVGQEVNGKILIYKNNKDLQKTKEYFDEAGKASAAFFSYTIEKDDIFVHLPKFVPEELVEKYKAALENL